MVRAKPNKHKKGQKLKEQITHPSSDYTYLSTLQSSASNPSPACTTPGSPRYPPTLQLRARSGSIGLSVLHARALVKRAMWKKQTGKGCLKIKMK
jgi:hypothetical protein